MKQKMIMNAINILKVILAVVLFQKPHFQIFMENTVLLKSIHNVVNYSVMD